MNITVLMTTYNCATFLNQSIKSVLKQTFKDFEFLIIDNGSTDNTESIVKSFKDNRINYHKIEHIGIGAASNYGLKYAKYDWIARMDADDICNPTRLEKQTKCINGDDKLIVSSWCAYFKNHKILFITDPPSDDLSIKEKLSLHSIVNHLGSLFNKNFILYELGGYDEKLDAFIDYDLWLRARTKATFFIVPQFLVFARVRINSVSDSKLYKKDKLFFELQSKHSSSKIKDIENLIILGWREYFYGDKNLVRINWLKVRMNNWNYRMYFAFIISFLPENLFNLFKTLRLRLRLEYFLNRNGKYKGLESEFRKLLLEIDK